MDLPQEIELWYIIPSIRREFALALKRRNLPQKEIASLLGITSSAISQYVRQKRAAIPISGYDNIRSEIEASTDRIVAANGKNSAVQEINRICKIIRDKGILCEIHRKKDPSLKECGACNG